MAFQQKQRMKGDDSKTPLTKITQRHGMPLVSLLLDIQKSQEPQTKYLRFVKNLECLSLGGRPRGKSASSDGGLEFECPIQRRPLLRSWINAFDDQNYVALSYTWKASEHEDNQSGKYEVQTRDKRKFFKSSVRDCVLDRALAYMRERNVDLLWIDKHSVKQKACKKSICHHTRCKQKQAHIQTMDLVYKLSEHPIALLGRPIDSQGELDLLFKVLAGRLVHEDHVTQQPRLSHTTSQGEALRALGLLSKIAKDYWWTRAWTFQENYRAGTKMTLLIRHPPFLEGQKRSFDPFQTVPGELCIKSVDFCEESTRLCLAIRTLMPQQADVIVHLEHVLATLGRYRVLLDRSMSMSPYIIADIQERDLFDAWDSLAIIANCCQYAIRMDINKIQDMSQSLSLSVLAMCILNGEILYNGIVRANSPFMSHMTVTQYLKVQAFNRFYAPRGEHSLTFNKGCRFVDVELKRSGIMTKGHLWRLGGIIHTARLPPPLPGEENPVGRLTFDQHARLTQLVSKLRSFGETTLANQIEGYLEYDSSQSVNQFRDKAFSKRYMHLMAVELAAAIEERKLLRLGSIWDPLKSEDLSTAIFIWGRDCGRGDSVGHEACQSNAQGQQRLKRQPAFAFTASGPKAPGSDHRSTNDLDQHVSLEVNWPRSWRRKPKCLPRLYIRRWLLGLCFFQGWPRTNVIFPWPTALQATGPYFR